MEDIWGQISLKKIKGISFYYVCILLFSIYKILFYFSNYSSIVITDQNILYLAITLSIFFGLAGNSMYYIRKIYKLCIQSKIKEKAENSIKEFGLVVYFFTRPLYTVFFSVFIVIILYTFISSLVIDKKCISQGFIFLAIGITSAVGYACGTFLDTIEEKFNVIARKIQ